MRVTTRVGMDSKDIAQLHSVHKCTYIDSSMLFTYIFTRERVRFGLGTTLESKRMSREPKPLRGPLTFPSKAIEMIDERQRF